MQEKSPNVSTGQAQECDLVACGKAAIHEKIGWETLSLEEALVSIEWMPHLPSVQNLTCIFHNCRTQKNLTYTKRLYAYLCKNGLEDHRALGNYVIPMLVHAGNLRDAQKVFSTLIHRNEYSWNSLIWGYVESGESKYALILYQKMQEDFVHPSKYTLVTVLKACARLRDIERGRHLNSELARKGLEKDVFVGSTLVDMYGKCGSLVEAQEAFDTVPIRDEVFWTALIAGYAEHGLGEEALNCLEQMQLEGLSPNEVTFVCSLTACGSIGMIDKAREMHPEILRKGLERDLLVGTTLVDMHAKCGALEEAQEAFDKLPVRDQVSWNALIAAYAEQGLGEEALNCLQQMQLESVSQDAVTCVCSLKACGSIRAIQKGQEMHGEVARKGLETDLAVGNTLVDMYAKCGSVVEAWEAFDALPVRDQVSWNALMSGYAEHGLGEKVWNGLEQMQLEGLSPNAITFFCSLKACGNIGAIDKGREIHAEIASEGLERDLAVASTLVDMYAKCGSLVEAHEAFNKLPIRDKALCNALIAGYAEHGLGEKALNCLEQMQLEGLSPNAGTLVCSLKACVSIGALDKGREIHAEIATKGLERDLAVGSILVDLYAKCSSLAEAQGVFDKLPVRDEVLWTALIAGYAEYGHGEEALNCVEEMQLEVLSPNTVTFVCSLKACGTVGAIDRGRQIHSEISRKGMETDLAIGSTLVDMYAKCGSLAEGQEAFDKLPVQDEVSWNALILGYAQHELGEEALKCLEQMQLEGLSPNAVTLICILKACGTSGAIDFGQGIHTEIARNGLEVDLAVGSTLVDMYSTCGSLAEAQEAFDKLPVQDEILWNALISGYAQHGFGEEVLNCLEQMQMEGLSPNAVIFVYSLKACGSIGAIEKGREIHTMLARKGLQTDLFVGNTLVDMYAKCCSLAEAQEAFDRLPVRDEVSWNALISGYAQHGFGEEALTCLAQMQVEGFSPYAVTYVCSLKACGSIGAIHKGREIHAETARKGLETDPVVGTTLVDMYGKCGSFAEPWETFDKLPVQDRVSWNALIAGYAGHGLGEEALHCLEQMQWAGLSPNTVTFVCSLKACGTIGAIDRGREMHAEIAGKGLERDLVVGNTVLDMYAKCGSLAEAQEAFDKMQTRDDISWNVLIKGYAQHGESAVVFVMLEKMRGGDIKPNGVTFSIVLAVCSHMGLVDKGQNYFGAMGRDYGITPALEHLAGMVDLLGRAGQLDEAVAMVKKIPFHPDLVLWQTVLGACQKWGNVELGRVAFEHALQLDEEDAASYVLMSNIFVHAHMQEEEKVETERV